MKHVQSWLCISGLNNCILNLFRKSTKVKGSCFKLRHLISKLILFYDDDHKLYNNYDITNPIL